METLSAEHRAVLEMYKKERPDIFARLPLPKKLAEEYGVPISSETVHLMTYMKNHLALTHGSKIDAFEEKVACKVTDASGIEILGKPKPRDWLEKMQNDWDGVKVRDEQIKNNMKARSEFLKMQPQESIEERSERWIQELQSESALDITEGSTNAAAIPQ